MLSSPRRPDSTMRIFSSAENCRRVARRIALITCSAGSFTGPDLCPIFAPSMATMGQKSSLPQLAPSVSQALMPDSVITDLIYLGSCTDDCEQRLHGSLLTGELAGFANCECNRPRDNVREPIVS